MLRATGSKLSPLALATDSLLGKARLLTGSLSRGFANEKALEASDAVQPLDPKDPRVREITVPQGIAFPGDLRSSSGLGLGDKLTSHTAKWQQVSSTIYPQSRGLGAMQVCVKWHRQHWGVIFRSESMHWNACMSWTSSASSSLVGFSDISSPDMCEADR